MSYLNDFLFSPERANSPVRTLSGGERSRLLLARLFALPANVLVLDEPTNDLDIDTLELLEELLQNYAGTVFLVSHDRRFLDNVVTSTIAWEGDPAFGGRAGPVARIRGRLRGLGAAASTRARAAGSGAGTRRSHDEPRDASGERQARCRGAEAGQAQLQGAARTRRAAGSGSMRSRREQKQLGELLADPALYASEPARIAQAQQRCAEIEEELMGALERWEALGQRG